jgi:hypothetical protein
MFIAIYFVIIFIFFHIDGMYFDFSFDTFNESYQLFIPLRSHEAFLFILVNA